MCLSSCLFGVPGYSRISKLYEVPGSPVARETPSCDCVGNVLVHAENGPNSTCSDPSTATVYVPTAGVASDGATPPPPVVPPNVAPPAWVGVVWVDVVPSVDGEPDRPPDGATDAMDVGADEGTTARPGPLGVCDGIGAKTPPRA